MLDPFFVSICFFYGRNALLNGLLIQVGIGCNFDELDRPERVVCKAENCPTLVSYFRFSCFSGKRIGKPLWLWLVQVRQMACQSTEFGQYRPEDLFCSLSQTLLMPCEAPFALKPACVFSFHLRSPAKGPAPPVAFLYFYPLQQR